MGTVNNVVPPIPTSTNTIPGASATGASYGSSATTSASSATNSSLSLASNFNTFLSLLTTQLQNQDPTNPTDSNQFTQQLVEFAGVQQQVQSNTYLQQILASTQGNQVSSASSYIGTNIQATGNQAALTTGGKATFGYTLASTAAQTQVTITDSSGNIVYKGAGTDTSGSNTFTWNGNSSFTGASEPSGVYNISVSAVDGNGNAVTATPYITGTVTSASISNGTVMLNLGALQVPTTNVTSITDLPSTGTGSLSSAMSSLSSEISSLSSELGSVL